MTGNTYNSVTLMVHGPQSVIVVPPPPPDSRSITLTLVFLQITISQASLVYCWCPHNCLNLYRKKYTAIFNSAKNCFKFLGVEDWCLKVKTMDVLSMVTGSTGSRFYWPNNNVASTHFVLTRLLRLPYALGEGCRSEWVGCTQCFCYQGYSVH